MSLSVDLCMEWRICIKLSCLTDFPGLREDGVRAWAVTGGKREAAGRGGGRITSNLEDLLQVHVNEHEYASFVNHMTCECERVLL